ncbi:MAG: hypothetical protein WAL61_13990 [Acidimicrobiales bacterium]
MLDLSEDIRALVESGIRAVSLEEVRGHEREQRGTPATRRRSRFVAGGIVVAVAAAVIALVLIPSGAPGGPSSAAATELRLLSARADDIPALQPGQYLYSEIETPTEYFAAALSPGVTVNGYLSGVVRTWINGKGYGRVLATTDKTAHLDTKADERTWKEAGSPPLPGPPQGLRQEETVTPTEAGEPPPAPTPVFHVADLPTNAAALRRVLESTRFQFQITTASQCADADCRVVSTAAALLQGPDIGATPELRGALYEVLSHVPGVTEVGTVKNRAGRSGLGLRYVERIPARTLQMHCAAGSAANAGKNGAIPFRMPASELVDTFVVDEQTTAVIGTEQIPTPAVQVNPFDPCSGGRQPRTAYNAPRWSSVLKEAVVSSDESTTPAAGR